MIPRRDAPLPLREVRDLLGIVRAMYRAESASTHPSSTKLARLKKIGESLTTALELASASTPGTVGHRAAWQHADDALEGLGREITLLESLEPVLIAARRAVSGERAASVRTKKPER
ncbi:MAG: hypothetical protein U0414_44215 [Polyangiaceae bacterium]|mgnify:CR=1 FL=1